MAGVRGVRGEGGKRETAYLAATSEVRVRGTVADNSRDGSTLFLTAAQVAAQVRVTSRTAGKVAAQQVRIPAGATVALRLPVAGTSQANRYAVTVEPASGGPVYVARMLTLRRDGISLFTVQPVPDDRSMVPLPQVGQDTSILLG